MLLKNKRRSLIRERDRALRLIAQDKLSFFIFDISKIKDDYKKGDIKYSIFSMFHHDCDYLDPYHVSRFNWYYGYYKKFLKGDVFMIVFDERQFEHNITFLKTINFDKYIAGLCVNGQFWNFKWVFENLGVLTDGVCMFYYLLVFVYKRIADLFFILCDYLVASIRLVK